MEDYRWSYAIFLNSSITDDLKYTLDTSATANHPAYIKYPISCRDEHC